MLIAPSFVGSKFPLWDAFPLLGRSCATGGDDCCVRRLSERVDDLRRSNKPTMRLAYKTVSGGRHCMFRHRTCST